MEKYVVFGPLVIFFAVFGLMIVLFLATIFRLIGKAKKSAWRGVVIDKKAVEIVNDEGPGTTTYYSLVVKTDEGKEIKVGVSGMDFEKTYQIGDRLEKKSGELRPHKV